MTPPEVRLWQLLRGSPAGIKFRRQYAIGPYVADFYCPAVRLVIEVDGQIHNFEEQAAHDAKRDTVIATYGVRIERVAAADIMRNASAVASAIIELCATGHE
jgi:very-short-patch-repair endonuclease